MQPHVSPDVWACTRAFYTTFYADHRDRIFVFGINPGRFGSGLTGIPFTDPIALESDCGIPNPFEKRRELSSEFLYAFIRQWGGVQAFSQDFFLTAVSPLGFVRDGVNYNYYDDPALARTLKPFVAESLQSQLACGAVRSVAIVLGTGRNQAAFSDLNSELRLFDRVHALEHPRYIMQYRRRAATEYLAKYRRTFDLALKG